MMTFEALLTCPAQFIERTPAQLPPLLRPWIERLWLSWGVLDASRERVLPSATTEIVLNLGPEMRLVEGEGDAQLVGPTLSGLLSAPMLLEHPTEHVALGIVMRPLGLERVLGLPASAFHGWCGQISPRESAPLQDLWERVRATSWSPPEQALDVAIQWLARQVERAPDALDPIVVWASEQLLSHHGDLSLSALQQQSGYGRTRFVERFRDALGVTPKHFARQARFRAALERLDPQLPLTTLAATLGFYDQAHMCRDFQHFAHATPQEVLAARYPSGVTMAL